MYRGRSLRNRVTYKKKEKQLSNDATMMSYHEKKATMIKTAKFLTLTSDWI